MKFISFGDLRKLGDSFLSIGSCLTDKDKDHRKENELIHETLRKDYAGSYGNFLNSVDNNRMDPAKAEELRRLNQSADEKTKKLEAELEQQKQINQALRTNTAVPMQYVQHNPNTLAPQPQQNQVMTPSPTQTTGSLEANQQSDQQSNQPSKVNDFFSKMYGK